MFKNHLKVAWRSLVRNKGYSFINIFGLAVGMAACLLILLFIRNELSYDRHNEHFARIQRVAAHVRFGGMEDSISVVPAPLAAAVLREFPEVEAAVRLRGQGNFIVSRGAQSFTESRFIFADASLFRVFTLPLRRGDPHTALAEPQTIVLSETTARKYFGVEDPVGRVLRLDNENDYRVTGVFCDIPASSHFQFDLIASLASLAESRETAWTDNSSCTYLLLRPNSDPAALQAKFTAFVRKYVGPDIQRITGRSIDEFFASGARLSYFLQPLADIHLRSQLRAEIGVNGDIRIVYIFSAIALLILAIAAVNFLNLATARSSGQAREAGVRKVLGSVRSQLVGQYLTDSLLLSGLAAGLTLLLAALALPFFNHLAGKQLQLGGADFVFTVAVTLVMALLVGLLAGSYPAWRLSAARPAEVLKGRLATGVSGGRLRGALVVFQFAISITLVIATLVVSRQLDYIQKKNLGFDREQVLILGNAYLLGDQAETLKNEMLQAGGVLHATVSGFLPVPSTRSDIATAPRGQPIDARSVLVQQWRVDADYIRTMGMRLVAGRDFSRSPADNFDAVIINQAAARQFNWPDPLGQKISFPTGSHSEIQRTVIGVVEDFHFETLRSPIAPLTLFIGKSRGNIAFRFQGENVAGILGNLKRLWQRLAPGQPFEYSFMDESFVAQYRSEQQLGTIFAVFATLAIFIACLGLLALASFLAEKRTKEIGIRKVVGASESQIVTLLSREFVKWVAIAALIAWPLAYYAMHRWLQGFAYRTKLGAGLFLLSSLLTLLIAILTVRFQAVRAARANPVDSLRYE